MKWNHTLTDSGDGGGTIKLPDLKHPRPTLDTPYVAPRNEIEQKVAGIWQQLLGIDAVGVEDNFFQLGGQSLVAIQVVARINDLYQIDLPVDTMFQDITVEKLTEHIKTLTKIKEM
jgi:acyl carrier protein